MLIRHNADGTFDCVSQEQHAVLSGLLAAAWRPAPLTPLALATVTMHDAPWRLTDYAPRLNPDTGLPHDFVDFPKHDKFAMYRDGLDEMEEVHPYVAYMVSRHYTTFSGTRDEPELTVPEAARRERLAPKLGDELLHDEDEVLRWLRFFDVFSLYLCLAGPAADPESVPEWTRIPKEAPDGTPCSVTWATEDTLAVDPWPFDEAPTTDVWVRRLPGRFVDQTSLDHAWNAAGWTRTPLTLTPSGR